MLLVHDTALSCVTSVVTGGPVSGSWWSHPRANEIYNALGEVEDDVVTVPLLRRKQTLVAARLWPDLVAVGASRSPWQLRGLPDAAQALLADVTAADAPFVVDTGRRAAGKALEQRLLVVPEEVHTDAGHHVKALRGWTGWAGDRGVVPTPDLDAAHGALAAAASLTLVDPGPLLPW